MQLPIVRVDVSSPDMDLNDPTGLIASAYAGPRDGEVIAVAVNYGDSGKKVAFASRDPAIADVPGPAC